MPQSLHFTGALAVEVGAGETAADCIFGGFTVAFLCTTGASSLAFGGAGSANAVGSVTADSRAATSSVGLLEPGNQPAKAATPARQRIMTATAATSIKGCVRDAGCVISMMVSFMDET
jgi:hypothetical protein